MQRHQRRPTDAGPLPTVTSASPSSGLGGFTSAYAPAVASAAAAVAATVAADFQRGASTEDTADAAEAPTIAGGPPRILQDMLSSAGSSTESSGYTESSSKTSLQSAESINPRLRPTAISSLFFRGDREQIFGSRASPLRPTPPRAAPLRPAPFRPLAPRQSLIQDKGVNSKDKGLTLKKPKEEVRRADIVAAVTKRLYTTKKKPDPSTSEEADTPEPPPSIAEENDEAVPEELQLCARARAKLQELSRRALAPALGRRLRPVLVDADVQTDLPRHTTRVKEKGVATDPYVQRVADAAVDTNDAPEIARVDVAVDTRHIPSDHVLRVREVATGDDAAAGRDVAAAPSFTTTTGTSVVLPPRARPPPHPPPHKHVCDSSCQPSTSTETKCFDCFLQISAEGREDGPFVIGTKTKSNQCNMFDELESKEVTVGVIPHSVPTCPLSGNSSICKDASVGTEKCFYHMKLQKYAGVTAVPAPVALTHNLSSDHDNTSNNFAIFVSGDRTIQLPIGDRLTNIIQDFRDKDDSKGSSSHFKSFRPHISHRDTYMMRKSLGTQTQGSKGGNLRVSWDPTNKWNVGEHVPHSHFPKKFKNYENQVSRSEQYCHVYPNNCLHKQVDDCFSDDSLDSCKSGEYYLEPDSLHDMQSCEHFSRYKRDFLTKKERNIRKTFCAENNLCPIHNKCTHHPCYVRRSRHHSCIINKKSLYHHSLNHHVDPKFKTDQDYERCNLHKEEWTRESKCRNNQTSRGHKDPFEWRQDDKLEKIINTNSASSNTGLVNTLEGTVSFSHNLGNKKVMRSSNDNPTAGILDTHFTHSRSSENLPLNNGESGKKQLFTINETPFYTFTKCNSGYVAKEVMSFTMSPVNFTQRETHIQSTQTDNVDVNDLYQNNDTCSKEQSTEQNNGNTEQVGSDRSNIDTLLCLECNEKIANFKNGSKFRNIICQHNTTTIENKINHHNRIPKDRFSDKTNSKDPFMGKECSSTQTLNFSQTSLNVEKLKNSSEGIINKEEKFENRHNCNYREEISGQNESELYSSIAYDQHHKEKYPINCTNRSISQELGIFPIEVTNSVDNNDPHCNENHDEIHNKKNNNDPTFVNSSLEQIKQCVQAIEKNIGKFYETEVKAESTQRETPNDITTKWIFRKVTPSTKEMHENSAHCNFETHITLNKSSTVLSNWTGLLKIPKASNARSNLGHKEIEEIPELSHTDKAPSQNSHTPTIQFIDSNDNTTDMQIEIKINDTQLNAGSITFGKNYTLFDTGVQNLKLLCKLGGDLLENSSNKSLENKLNQPDPLFSENVVISFAFEDGGYQPLLNVLAQQSKSQNCKQELTSKIDNEGKPEVQSEPKELNSKSITLCENEQQFCDQINIVSTAPENIPQIISKTVDSRNLLDNPNAYLNHSSNATQEVEGSSFGNTVVNIINTQPTNQSNPTLIHSKNKLPIIKNKHGKQTMDGRANPSSTTFFKKSLKKKKRCYPLSAPSCMWNFMERQTSSSDTMPQASKRCSTISSFIEKANNLLTRLNEVTSMLDKGKRKQDLSTLISEQDFEPIDENGYKSDPQLDIDSQCTSQRGNVFGENSVATISQCYDTILNNPTTPDNTVKQENNITLKKEKSISEINESRKSVNGISHSGETSHQQDISSPFTFINSQGTKSYTGNTPRPVQEALRSEKAQCPHYMENATISMPQTSTKHHFSPYLPSIQSWNSSRLQCDQKQNLRPEVNEMSGYDRNNAHYNNVPYELNQLSCKNTSSYYNNSNVSFRCIGNEQKSYSKPELYNYQRLHEQGEEKEYPLNEKSCINKKVQYSKFKSNNKDTTYTFPLLSTRNSILQTHKNKECELQAKRIPTRVKLSAEFTKTHFQNIENFTTLTATKLHDSFPISHYITSNETSFPIYTSAIPYSIAHQHLPDEQDIKSEEKEYRLSTREKYYQSNNLYKSKIIHLNSFPCEECTINERNIDIQRNKSFIQAIRNRTLCRKRNPFLLDNTPSKHISSFISSPRAYMQYLLQLRRQIVGLNMIKHSANTDKSHSSHTD